MTTIGIAGLSFSLECGRTHFEALRPQTYSRFFKEADPGGAHVRVLIRRRSTASVTPALQEVLFDIKGYWTLLKRGCLRSLIVEPNRLPEPFCVARFDPAADSVEIDYSPHAHNSDHRVQHPFEYPVDRVLTIYFLSRLGGLLCHSAGGRIAGGSYMFPGLSTAGKSTLAGLLMGAGSGWSVISDERTAIACVGNRFQAFGTPWHGDLKVADPEGSDLRGVLFLRQADEDRISELPRSAVIPRLLPLVSITWYDEEVMPRQLETVERLVSSVPGFELAFRPTRAVVDTLTAFASRNF